MAIELFNPNNLNKKFDNPRDEVEYLRNRLKNIEASVKDEASAHEAISKDLDVYGSYKPEHVMSPKALMPEEDVDTIVLNLSPEKHDDKMTELMILMQKKGISHTIDIVSRLEDPHISDDFHRFLIQYLRSDYYVKGADEGDPMSKSLNRTLFEIIPRDSESKERTESNFRETVASMEQFFAGLMGVISGSFKNEYITLEIANPIDRQDFVFYISIVKEKAELLEKQLHAFFPDARLVEQNNDFNIFYEGGGHAGAYGTQAKTPARTLKTSEEFEDDPIKSVLNVFSNLEESTEAAAVQLIFKPAGSFYEKNYQSAIKKLEKGSKEPRELFTRDNPTSKISTNISKFLFDATKTVEKVSGTESKKDGPEYVDSILVEQIKRKLMSPIVSTNIRVIASAKDKTRANSILQNIGSSFNQFSSPTGNSIKFESVKQNLEGLFFKRFSYRVYNPEMDVPLNLKEIATIFHLPTESNRKNPNLKVSRSASSSAPIGLPNDGILIGSNEHAGKKQDIFLATEDRMRHLYTIGQTGTGKTTLMKSLIIQDIKNGDGVCMIDPHGSDIQDVLANIPPERFDDVIYFDPANIDRPMALNMLEFDQTKPEQKTFVVNELFGIFQKLYGKVPESMGPIFEQYFRNATMLVIEDPETGCTLLDVSRVMADKAFRKLKISKCKNPVIVQFWKEIAEKAGGESSLQNIVPYITSKFDVFLANEIMRPVIAQEKSSFNFRDIMDNKKILLVNLSKGRLGDINSSLIGLIIVGKILMAALSRVDGNLKQLAPFYLYIDEFQNVTTDSIATILSEARKYRLSLTIAHQFIAQLEDNIKNAVFGNVGNMAVFRVGADDSEYLKSQFAPTFTASDIMNIDNFNAYVKVLSKGIPQKPFNIRILPPVEGNQQFLEKLKNMSYNKFGRDRFEIEQEIMDKYKKPEEPKELDMPDFSKIGL